MQPPIVEAMARRYRTCRSYEDQGVATTTRWSDDGSRRSGGKLTFHTAFERAGGGFKFEFASTTTAPVMERRGVLWRTGQDDGHVWRSGEDPQPTDVLAGAHLLASATTEVSGRVPPLLLNSDCVAFAVRFQSLEDEIIGGVACEHLKWTRGDQVLELWIGKVDLGLRKVLSRNHLQPRALSPDEYEKQLLTVPNLTPELRDEMIREHAKTPVLSPFTVEDVTEYSPVFDQPVTITAFSADTTR